MSNLIFNMVYEISLISNDDILNLSLYKTENIINIDGRTLVLEKKEFDNQYIRNFNINKILSDDYKVFDSILINVYDKTGFLRKSINIKDIMLSNILNNKYYFKFESIEENFIHF